MSYHTISLTNKYCHVCCMVISVSFSPMLRMGMRARYGYISKRSCMEELKFCRGPHPIILSDRRIELSK